MNHFWRASEWLWWMVWSKSAVLNTDALIHCLRMSSTQCLSFCTTLFCSQTGIQARKAEVSFVKNVCSHVSLTSSFNSQFTQINSVLSLQTIILSCSFLFRFTGSNYSRTWPCLSKHKEVKFIWQLQMVNLKALNKSQLTANTKYSNREALLRNNGWLFWGFLLPT